MKWNESNVRLNQRRWTRKIKMKRKPFWPIEKRVRWCARRRHHHQHQQQLSWHIKFIYWWMYFGCAFPVRIYFTHSLFAVCKHKERCEKCFRSSIAVCRFISFLLFVFLSSDYSFYLQRIEAKIIFIFTLPLQCTMYSTRANPSIERCKKKKKK